VAQLDISTDQESTAEPLAPGADAPAISVTDQFIDTGTGDGLYPCRREHGALHAGVGADPAKLRYAGGRGIELHVREDSTASDEHTVIAMREAVRAALGRSGTG